MMKVVVYPSLLLRPTFAADVQNLKIAKKSKWDGVYGHAFPI